MEPHKKNPIINDNTTYFQIILTRLSCFIRALTKLGTFCAPETEYTLLTSLYYNVCVCVNSLNQMSHSTLLGGTHVIDVNEIVPNTYTIRVTFSTSPCMYKNI